jgi:hypothetical protein
VFTAAVGVLVAPGHLHSVVGFTHTCIVDAAEHRAAVNDGVRPPEISANFAKFSAQVKIVSPQDFRRFHRRGGAEMGGAGQGVGAKVE